MKLKKRYIALVVIVLIIVVTLFVPFGGTQVSPLPIYPVVATTPGRYELDDTRFVEVREREGRIEYSEGEVISRSENENGPQQIITRSHPIQSISLGKGWSVGLSPPDTIVIDSGSGLMMRRVHGEQEAIEVDLSKVTRRPSKPRPGSLADRMKYDSGDLGKEWEPGNTDETTTTEDAGGKRE